MRVTMNTALAAVLLCSSAVMAQDSIPTDGSAQGSSPYVLQRNARLVILDAVVVDAKGNPIPDLKRDDFHVTEMGEPQVIQDFEPAGQSIPPRDVEINSTAELDKKAPRAPVNIIVLDEFNTLFEDMAFARYSLKKFLEKQPDKLEIPTMLIAVNMKSLTIVKDYTQDKAGLLRALEKHLVAYPWQAHNSIWVAQRYALTFVTLRRVALATAGHFGHKNMIWVGRGFPPFNFAASQLDDQARVDTAVQDTVNTLRDARVTLYTIDPAGMQIDPAKYGSAAELYDPLGGNFEFAALAKATGGVALFGRNDVDAEIGTAIQKGSNFYTLTYRPTNSSNDLQQFRKILMTVDRPKAKVLTRHGYYLAYDPGLVDRAKPSSRLMIDLLSAEGSRMVYDGVPVTLEKDPSDEDAVVLHVDGSNIPWSQPNKAEPPRVELVVMCSLFDKKGKEIDRDARYLNVSAGPDGPSSRYLDRALNFRYRMKQKDHAARARFVLRMTSTGRIGTADLDLKK